MLKGSNDIVQILFLFSGSGNCDVGRHNYAPIMYLKTISLDPLPMLMMPIYFFSRQIPSCTWNWTGQILLITVFNYLQ